jgi:hypothetical protein
MPEQILDRTILVQTASRKEDKAAEKQKYSYNPYSYTTKYSIY